MLKASLTILTISLLFILLPATAEASLIAPERACGGKRADSSVSKSVKIRAMTCLVNYARRKAGLRAYRTNSKLKRSALYKSRDILRCKQFSHTACGRPFDYWIKRSRYPKRCHSIGENIAWGSASGGMGNVRSIFTAWMRSTGHRRAILDRTFRDFGVNYVTGRFQGVKASIWTQHFGKNC